MRKVTWNEVEESAGGDFDSLPDGGYVLKVIAAHDEDKEERVWMEFDIAEGRYAGFFDNDFYSDKPYAHQLMLSYKDAALGLLKHRIGCFSKSNPGFDAEAAWNGGKLDMFVGKLIGAAVVSEVKESKKGNAYDCPDWFHALIYPAQTIRDAIYTLPKLKEQGKQDTPAASTTDVYSDEDIPF